MPTISPPADLAPSRVEPNGRSVFGWCAGGAAAIAAYVTAAYLIHPDPIQVHAEGGPLELAQLACWLTALLVAAAMILRQRGLDRVNALWLATIAALASAREFDIHEAANSDALGVMAVHFKSRWVMDAAVPLWVKGFWGLVALLIVLLLVAPPLLVRAPLVALLRRRDAALILFILSAALIVAGYLADDVFGRGLITSEEPMQAGEEVLELVGVAAFLASALLTFRYPLSHRIAAARAPEVSSAHGQEESRRT